MEERDAPWHEYYQDQVATVITFAVFAAGFAWIMGVLHVPVDYPERYAMAAIILFATAYVVSDGVEVAIKRLFASGYLSSSLYEGEEVAEEGGEEVSDGTIFSGSEES